MALGQPHLDKSQYWQMKRRKETEARILETCGAAAVLIDYEQDREARIETAEYLAHDTLQLDARTVLDQISSEYEQVLVTLRTNAVNLDQELRNLDLPRYFSAVLSAPTTHPRWKVKVGLIQTWLRDRNRPPGSHLLITDTDTDIRSGHELEFRTLGVANGIRDRAILEAARPDLVLDQTSEISALINDRTQAVWPRLFHSDPE